jgi:mannose-6-phosphate isomerase-like protein (cupin superfamily)
MFEMAAFTNHQPHQWPFNGAQRLLLLGRRPGQTKAPARLSDGRKGAAVSVSSGDVRWRGLMSAMAADLDADEGREILIDLARAAADASGAYANFVLTRVDDHVVRMSVMTEPFYWHRHPDSDETFLVLEGDVLLETANERIKLGPGQLYTVPAGLAHVTSPITARSVNITVEKTGMSTERLTGPAQDPGASV